MDDAVRKEEAAARALAAAISRFSLTEDRAFARLREQLGVLAEAAATAPRRALLLVALAWLVPLALTLIAGTAFGPREADPYLRDWGAWARFFFAVPLLVVIDRLVDDRLRGHLAHFVDAPLIAPVSMPAAADAVATAIARAHSAVATALCAALAFALSASGAATLPYRTAGSWLAAGAPGSESLTAAGWWVVLVSGPLFWFLLLRWLWRHLVWALLLRHLSTLTLRLVATHPDGVAGLGFLGRYPNVFAALVLAMSAALAAAIARAFENDALSVQAYGGVMTGWLAVMTAIFAAPLAAFGKPLRALKEATLDTAAARGTRHFRAAERDTLGRNVAAADSGPEEPAPDPSKLYAAANKLGTLPFSRSAILPLGAAALLPLIAAGATRIPFMELWKVAKRLLLL